MVIYKQYTCKVCEIDEVFILQQGVSHGIIIILVGILIALVVKNYEHTSVLFFSLCHQ